MRWAYTYTKLGPHGGWEQAHVWEADNGAVIALYPPRLQSGFAYAPNGHTAILTLVGGGLSIPFVVYSPNEVGWDSPERIPKYIREKVGKIVTALAAGTCPEDI